MDENPYEPPRECNERPPEKENKRHEEVFGGRIMFMTVWEWLVVVGIIAVLVWLLRVAAVNYRPY